MEISQTDEKANMKYPLISICTTKENLNVPTLFYMKNV